MKTIGRLRIEKLVLLLFSARPVGELNDIYSTIDKTLEAIRLLIDEQVANCEHCKNAKYLGGERLYCGECNGVLKFKELI